MSNALPNWHFHYLAPIYDYMSFDRDYETIFDRLKLSKGDNLLISPAEPASSSRS